MKARLAVPAVFVVIAMLAVSGCWSSTGTVSDPGGPGGYHPNWYLHHDFSLSPGLWPGYLTDCFYVLSSVDRRNAMCRLVEGDEEVGQPGNWDVTFYDGQEQPVAADCTKIFFYGCSIIAPDGKGYEGCHMYYIDGGRTYWCDYRTSYHFIITLNDNPWHYVLHTFWNWGEYMSSVTQCAYGLLSIAALQQTVDNDWLVSCFDGP